MSYSILCPFNQITRSWGFRVDPDLAIATDGAGQAGTERRKRTVSSIGGQAQEVESTRLS